MDEGQYAVPPGDRGVLLDAIGRVSGLDRPFREHPPPSRWWHAEDDGTPEPPEGVAVQVLGGVIDESGDRVAWVERYVQRPDGDDAWVSVSLKLAGDGIAGLRRIEGRTNQEPKPQVSVGLVPDRPDKVIEVGFLGFFDSDPESLIVVYDWAGGGKRLCRLTLRAPGLYGVQAHWVGLNGTAAVVLDGSWDQATLWYLRESYPHDDELMYGLRLPDLAPLVPIPVPRLATSARYVDPTLVAGRGGSVRWGERLTDDGGALPGSSAWWDGRSVELRLPGPRQSGFVEDASLVWDRLRAVLDVDAPPDGPDILIGALAAPFWDPTGPVSPGGRTDMWEVSQGSWWFPAGWYHYLRTPVADGGVGRRSQAAAWLEWLDRLDSQADNGQDRTGWDPTWSREEGVTRFALIHLRRQAGALAAACRAGTVPVLGDFGTWRRPPVLSTVPPGFARAWRELPDRFRAGSFPVGPPDPSDVRG